MNDEFVPGDFFVATDVLKNYSVFVISVTNTREYKSTVALFDKTYFVVLQTTLRPSHLKESHKKL